MSPRQLVVVLAAPSIAHVLRYPSTPRAPGCLVPRLAYSQHVPKIVQRPVACSRPLVGWCDGRKRAPRACCRANDDATTAMRRCAATVIATLSRQMEEIGICHRARLQTLTAGCLFKRRASCRRGRRRRHAPQRNGDLMGCDGTNFSRDDLRLLHCGRKLASVGPSHSTVASGLHL